jgi:hypothetical protein
MAWVDRSYFIVRRRYRQAGIVGAVLAVVVTALNLVPHVHGAETALVGDAGWGMLGALLMLALAAVVPPALANLAWRLHRRRYLIEA